MKKAVKATVVTAAILIAGYFILMIPDRDSGDEYRPAPGKPFTWNRDDLWRRLERIAGEARLMDTGLLSSRLACKKKSALQLYSLLGTANLSPGDTLFASLLDVFFEMAPLVAAGSDEKGWYIRYYNDVRNAAKEQSRRWDMKSGSARNTIYELLYGMRAAVEEVQLHKPEMTFDPVMFVKDEPSVTPSARIFGITVHSGDLLVSRGGAVVSALISRGNDYPGNFSHVALIYVDDRTMTPYLIEALIEKGVAVSSLAHYVADKKLRFMVMRPRANLVEIARDPMLPHRAARYMYELARSRHIPYDFKMNCSDASAMFCSEVASSAYDRYGIVLWSNGSTISSPQVAALLHAFGVEHFTTMMPSDLEYDPQLAVVAEWKDPQTLFRDHVWNAAMDVMLEHSGTGQEIRINPWMLPVARVVKVFSALLNLFDRQGPIPEGMSATQGLRNNALDSCHARIRDLTGQMVTEFIAEHGYTPTYPEMNAMAEKAWSRIACNGK